MHREHDVSVFLKHRKKRRGRCFFFKSPKNRIVKNWKTSHREKHRIVKKSEHRPPLGGGGSIPIQRIILQNFLILRIYMTHKSMCPKKIMILLPGGSKAIWNFS